MKRIVSPALRQVLGRRTLAYLGRWLAWRHYEGAKESASIHTTNTHHSPESDNFHLTLGAVLVGSDCQRRGKLGFRRSGLCSERAASPSEKLTLSLVALIPRIADEVEPRNSVCRRNHLGRDYRAGCFSNIRRVGQVASSRLQNRSNTSEEGWGQEANG